ncbi:GIN domain-containing protein [Aquimarina sp. W85]|uniref:GIN domain-containing protein n=1 Tax=Aquimarina rhodophyticola TaxID=3342246 RepID=UPI00367348B2
MNTQKILFTIMLLVFVAGTSVAQKEERLKGNKIVMTDLKEIDAFHTLKIEDNFEVNIQEGSENSVSIKADSNLQDAILVNVQDSILTIKTDKDIRRAKSLHLTITYTSIPKHIELRNDVKLSTAGLIDAKKLSLHLYNNAEAFMSVTSNKFVAYTYGKSSGELHVNAKEIFYQINENSEIKGITTADSLKVDLYQKGFSKLEGKIDSALIRADNSTNFRGEKLTINMAKLIAEGTSDCYLLVNEVCTIEAKDSTEVYLLGEPKVNLEVFSGEATLYKKGLNYAPSLLKL